MMKLTRQLTALSLAIAIAPALAMSTTAFADDRSSKRADTEQRAGEHFMSRKPAGALYAEDVIGTTVKHRQSGDDVGEIQDLIISDKGRVVAVVVTTGGFLGLGGQDVSLAWDRLNHAIEDDESVFYVNINKETLKKAPEYKRD